MLDLVVKFEDITISNIQKKDLENIKIWVGSEKLALDMGSNYIESLEERFLESYLSECEFFAKIDKNDINIGIIKGRVEFKQANELWIWYYFIDDCDDKAYLEKRILEEVLKHFNEEFDINYFYTRVIKEEKLSVKLWENLGFIASRVVKDYYNIDGMNKDMLILAKQHI